MKWCITAYLFFVNTTYFCPFNPIFLFILKKSILLNSENYNTLYFPAYESFFFQVHNLALQNYDDFSIEFIIHGYG